MNFEAIKFPIEGNVQSLAHFIDTQGTYIFTFGSPFCYTSPADLKEKKAFILGKFNPQKKKKLDAESVYAYFINGEDKKPHPDPRVKASVRESKLYDGEGALLGTIQILLQRGMFRSYQGINANPVYDAEGKLTAFCHYNNENKTKDIYSCSPDFRIPSTPLTNKDITPLLSAGTVHRVFSYDIVESEEADTKDRFFAIFSPEKKSELTNNRVRFYGCEDNDRLKLLLLTALFAFFWGTYVDIPLS